MRLPDVAHSVVMRRLRHLLDRELVIHEHRPGQPPHARSAPIPHEARYDLTDAGRMLLEVTAEAGRWEQTWCSQDERREPAGALAIKLTADEHTRKIGLLLADGPLSTKDLDRRAPELCRSALRRRLRELVLAGLLERRVRGRNSRYELTSRARHLAHVAMLAGRWEWQWSRPQHPAPGRDLNELLHIGRAGRSPCRALGGHLPAAPRRGRRRRPRYLPGGPHRQSSRARGRPFGATGGRRPRNPRSVVRRAAPARRADRDQRESGVAGRRHLGIEHGASRLKLLRLQHASTLGNFYLR